MFYRLFKRTLDFFVALFLLIVSLPLFLCLCVLILFFLGWPALFIQLRPGLNSKPFKLYKFRTMKPGSGPDGERLPPIGRLIRSLSLDEIPQLFNVLKGDMSLVGPRPLLMQYLNRYSPRQSRRHEVKPGITGWAQVKGRNSISWDEKFDYDIWYVENRSFYLDLKILFLTALTVIQRKGVSQKGHVTMPEFMGSKDH